MQQTKKEERYERILEEAAKLFVAKGYEQTTVSDIVKACDMARGTFYLYFESLEEVLKALFSKVMNLLWQEAMLYYDGTETDPRKGEEILKQIIYGVFRRLDEQRDLLTVFRCGGGQVFNEFKYKAIRDNLGIRIADLIRNDPSGTMRPTSPELMAMMITTLIDQMAYYVLVLEKDTYPQEYVIQQLCDFILYGLCNTP